MFVACGIWCLADVSSVSPSLEQTIEVSRPNFHRKVYSPTEYVLGDDVIGHVTCKNLKFARNSC